ncbi:hypothetical protein D3C86_980890 [compost metagenome]
MLDGLAADIFESQGFGVIGAFVAHRADQARTALAVQREHGEEIRFIEIQVQFAIGRRSAGLHIGNIENLLISPTGKPGVEGFAHD